MGTLCARVTRADFEKTRMKRKLKLEEKNINNYEYLNKKEFNKQVLDEIYHDPDFADIDSKKTIKKSNKLEKQNNLDSTAKTSDIISLNFHKHNKKENKNHYFSEGEIARLKSLYANNPYDTIHDKKQQVNIINIRKGELIGKGAYGRVYQGFEDESGQILAIKEIELSSWNTEKISSFMQEIKILSKLHHQNIVKYYGAIKNTKEKTLQIYLEYCIGGSIARMLEQYQTFSEQIIRKFTKQILEGLEFLHFNNIIHRDIKGENILVDNDGVCKLSDFGGAKVIVELENKKESLKGTPNWMAPEIIKTGEEPTRFSDIWSVGCTIIEMLTGQPPWSDCTNHYMAMFKILETNEPPKIPDHVSPELNQFLSLCLKMNPTERANVSQLLRHPFIVGTRTGVNYYKNYNSNNAINQGNENNNNNTTVKDEVLHKNKDIIETNLESNKKSKKHKSLANALIDSHKSNVKDMILISNKTKLYNVDNNNANNNDNENEIVINMIENDKIKINEYKDIQLNSDKYIKEVTTNYSLKHEN